MFDSARQKLARARDQLELLKSEFGQFCDGKPYAITEDFDAERGQRILTYEPVPLDLRWPVILGEILYDLRSALDHVVYELGGPVEKSEFPIFEHRWKYGHLKKKGMPSDISGLKKIEGITHQGARDYIEALQPYRAGNDVHTTALWILHKLNNIDKHRTLHLCRRKLREAVAEFDPYIVFSDAQIILPGNFEERTVIARLWGQNRDMKMDVRYAFYIAFDEGELPTVVGQPPDTICEGLVVQVAMIVDRLESIVSI